MPIYELINPSDKITFEGDDDLLAAVAVLYLGKGQCGLDRTDTGETVLPIMVFAGNGYLENWLKDRGIDDLGDYLKANRRGIAAFYRSIVYGGAKDREALAEMVKDAKDEEAAKRMKAVWNDKRRTSLSNYEKVCLELADRFERTAEAREEAEKAEAKEATEKNACANCGKPSEGEYAIHRDGFGIGPEVPLCNACGSETSPSCSEIWGNIRRRGTYA